MSHIPDRADKRLNMFIYFPPPALPIRSHTFPPQPNTLFTCLLYCLNPSVSESRVVYLISFVFYLRFLSLL